MRHYAALTLAILPALAYLATISMDMALGGRPPVPDEAVKILALRCLAHGFIVTSLLWASCLSAILDRQLYCAALFLAVAAVCSLVGVIHSPLSPEAIAWPWEVVQQMKQVSTLPALLCQSPYHWAGGYLLAAALLVTVGVMDAKRNEAR